MDRECRRGDGGEDGVERGESGEGVAVGGLSERAVVKKTRKPEPAWVAERKRGKAAR